ncbi:MAG: universal stress protein [Pseudomonadota bacterium]|nr:universal stress protein [Pseudomonadota bacterium]
MAYALKTILYATDLGPRGPEVFDHAAGLAKQTGACIHIVHAIEPLTEFAHSLVDTYVPAEVLESLREDKIAGLHGEVQRRLDEYCKDELHAQARASVADVRVVEGHPAEVILDEARRSGADLIVMGSRGHTALGEMLLGSVTHKVVMKARLPVLLVPLT